MKTEQFYEALEQIDDRYLLEAMTCHSENQKVIPFRSVKKQFPCWAAACIALLLILPASAEIFYGSISQMLAPLYGGIQLELADALGTSIGESVEIGDYVLTADAAIGDSYNLAIVYSLARSDGEPLDQELCFQRWENTVLPHAVSNVHSQWNEDGTKVTIIQRFASNKPLYQAKKAAATFHNLCISSKPGMPGDILVRGDWTLRFPVRYDDSSISLLREKTEITGNDARKYTISSITASSVGLHILFKTETPYAAALAQSLESVLEQQEIGAVTETRKPTAVYVRPDWNSPRITELPEGTQIEILELENVGGVGWAYVRCVDNGGKGWLCMDTAFAQIEKYAMKGLTISLRMKDGSELKFDPIATGILSFNPWETEMDAYFNIMFESPIALDEMDALQLCGKEFPIETP